MLTMRVKRFIKKTGKKMDLNDKETVGFNRTKVECYNCHRRGYFARECRAPRNQGYRNRDALRRNAPVDTSTTNALVVQDGIGNFVLMAYTSQGSSSSSSDSEYDQHCEALNKSNLEIIGYQMGLESLEARIVIHEKNEAVYEEDIAFLKYDVQVKDISIKDLNNQLEEDLKEKDDLKLKLEKIEESSKNLTKLINSQISAKDKTGLGYDSQINESEVVHSIFNSRESDVDDSLVNDRFKSGEGFHAVPPPYTGNYMPSRPDLSFAGLDDSVYKTKVSETETSISKTSKNIVENPKTVRPSAPIIEEWDTDNDNDSVFRPKSDQTKPNFTKINFVKSGENVKSINKENTHRQVEYPRKSQSPKDNRRNWNGMMTQKLGNGFESIKKACFVYGSDHLIKDCDFYENKMRVNHQNKLAHPHPKRNFVPTAVATKSGQVPVNAAKQSSPRTTTSISTARPVNTAAPKPKVNDALPITYSYFKAHSPKISVLFTETECLILSPDFKLLDESQVLLKVPRHDNMYSFDLKNVVPSGGKVCLQSLLKMTILVLLVRRESNTKPLNRVLVTKPHNKTPYELLHGRPPSISFMRPFGCPVTILNTLDPLGKFDGKADEGFLVGYSINSKAFRVFNTRTRKVEENLHITFLENKPNVAGSGPNWLFYIDLLTKSMNYELVTAGNQTNRNACIKDNVDAVPTQQYILLPLLYDSPQSSKDAVADDAGKKTNEEPANEGERNDQEKEGGASNKEDDQNVQDFRVELDNLLVQEKEGYANITNRVTIDTTDILNTSIFSGAYDDEDEGAEADLNNLKTTMNVSPIPTTRIHKDHPKDQIIRDINSSTKTRRMTKISKELDLVEPKKVIQALDDPSWIETMQEELLQFKLQKVWTLVDLPNGKRAIGTKWVFRNKKDERGIMDVKSAFLYGTIEEEVYVCQPPGFEDPQFPDKVYKVEKALYGLHQAPRAWYETLSTYLLENRFRRGIIDKTLFIKKDKGDILLVQVYVDDIIFGSTKKSLCTEFESLMHKKFQMSSMGELTFFLGLQVMQRDDGIFISQDKYVADILKKFDFVTMKTASTPIETNKALLKDEEAEDVDVHLYRSMIGSLMYLTASRPDIMFAVCGMFKVPRNFTKDSHHQCYHRFDLEGHILKSDYSGASLNRNPQQSRLCINDALNRMEQELMMKFKLVLLVYLTTDFNIYLPVLECLTPEALTEGRLISVKMQWIMLDMRWISDALNFVLLGIT
ncbi:putative ribonuclease H-like domain-containing protein [Tanacetum coccineum]